jgi:phosphoribosylanthranilate isomerase
MKVKICGLTRLEDALAALDAGADLLGFNFHPASPRYIETAACAQMVSELRKRGVKTVLVGVFVNRPAGEIAAVLDACHLDLAQLSGDEPPETLAALGRRAFKALRARDAQGLEESWRVYPMRTSPPACLVDAYRPGLYGGTGQLADWSLAGRLARRAPILLAGGLTPENVAEAIRQVRPWGVDVASGVEASPGRKDPARVLAFIRAARNDATA